MSDNIVELRLPNNDAILMGHAMDGLEIAMASLMKVKHPLGDTLFHMVHSVSFYVEKYLCDQDIYSLPRPVWNPEDIDEEQ